jgi:hypothetical protein
VGGAIFLFRSGAMKIRALPVGACRCLPANKTNKKLVWCPKIGETKGKWKQQIVEAISRQLCLS